MADSDQEKTEAPTPKKRLEARQQGQVARSTDLSAAVTLLAGVLLLYVFGMKLLEAMRLGVQTMLAGEMADNPTRLTELRVIPLYFSRLMGEAVLPVMLGIFAACMAVMIAQVGFLISTQSIEPKLSKIDPIKGFKNLVSPRAWIRLSMAVLKVILLSAAAGWVIMRDVPAILHLADLDTLPLFAASLDLIFALALKLCALLIVLAIIDYAFQKWNHERELKMSKDEVKQEMKQMEGDPLVKQRRARVARQIALQRINNDVPKSDVVVTNPTHFAVALSYDSDTMQAPKVVAKGADHLAARIRQIAQIHNIPLVERKELARGLYRDVEVGQQIPPQFFAAVAEILAYVYRLSGRKSA